MKEETKTEIETQIKTQIRTEEAGKTETSEVSEIPEIPETSDKESKQSGHTSRHKNGHKNRNKNRNKKKIRRLLIIIILILAMVAASCYTIFIKPKLEADTYLYKESPVEFGDLQVGIMESGSITTEEETQTYDLDLVEDSEGDTESDDDDVDISEYAKFEAVYVAVGQRILAGDPIYKLKESTVNNIRKKLALEAAEAETTLSEADISNSLDTLEATHTQISDNLSGGSAQGIYDISVAKLNNEVSGYIASIRECYANIDTYNEKIADYQLDDDHDGITNYEETKQKYEAAQKKYLDADKNNERTFVTIQSDYITKKDTYDSMLQDISDNEDKVKEEEDNITDYLAKIQDAQANAGVEVLSAKQILETNSLAGTIAGDTYQYSVATAEQDVTDAQSDVDDANEKLDDFNAFAGEDGTIYAESDGMVTAVNYEEGDTLESNSDLISYVTESSITLSVDVSQEDVVDITVGDSVNIAFTAYPDENYEGTVTAITTTATSDHATTVSYPVTIKVKGDTSKLYAGMTGDVTFVTDQKSQVLYVSRKAIVEQNGRTYVYTKDKNGEMTLTKVTTGFTDGVNVEITDGLSRGDMVYIASLVTNSGESEDATKE
ncbi:MAG: efflux RND transporter periplasmic adaptor subunit [Lachnospiraceae bacterium]|nr:efflux RND transporter periplasmic adaptor subunit [Lachnospiraceae bacterium]